MPKLGKLQSKIQNNDKIGFLTIVDMLYEPGKNKRKYYYVCECECGQICEIWKNVLTRKIKENKMVSCGCQNPKPGPITEVKINFGTKVGDVTVLDLVEKSCANRKLKFYNCICSCGKSCTKEKSYLENIEKKNRDSISCGCIREINNKNRIGEAHQSYKGHKEIPGRILSNIRYNSKEREKRGRKCKCTISAKYLWQLFIKQNGRCAYSNMKLVINNSNGQEQTASVDRIDSSKGYIPGNVQWVHKYINVMKNSHSHENFIKLCTDVANNQQNNDDWNLSFSSG